MEARGLSRSSPGARRPLAALVQAAVSLVALAAVVWWATRQEAPELPRTGEALGWLGLALVVYAGATVARAERWHRIVRRTGVAVPRGETWRLTTVGYMGNNVLPARSGDLLRAFLLAYLSGRRKREALGTVVAERLLDALALTLVFVVAIVVFVRDASVPGGETALVAALVAAALAVAVVAAFALAGRAGGLRRVRDLVRPLMAPTRELLSSHGVGLLGASFAVWALEAAVYLAVAQAAGLDLAPLESLYVVGLTNLFALVPAAPGYVGTFDAAVVFAVDSLGASGSEALAYLVLLRFLLFVPITLVGLAFLVMRYGGWSRLRVARLD